MDDFKRGYNGWTGSAYRYQSGVAAKLNEERMRREADNARDAADRARFKQSFAGPYVSPSPKATDFGSRDSTTIYPAGPLGTSTGSSIGGFGSGLVLLMSAAAAILVVWPWLVNVGVLGLCG